MWARFRVRRRMKRYLRNRASEAEQVRIEEAWFADDAAFEELEATELEMIDAFVRGGLTERERSAVEARAESSLGLRNRIAVARLLIDEASRHSSQGAEAPFPGSLVATSRSRRWSLALLPAAGLALLVLAAGMWWFGREPAERAASGVRATQLDPIEAGRKSDAVADLDRLQQPGEPQPPSAPAAHEPLGGRAIAVTLFPGMPRGVEQGSAISLSAATARLELSLEYEGEAYETYDAVIRTPEGRMTWERSGVKRGTASRPSVTVTVDAQVLRAGDYVLTLVGRRPDGTRADIAEYAFRIVRR